MTRGPVWRATWPTGLGRVPRLVEDVDRERLVQRVAVTVPATEPEGSVGRGRRRGGPALGGAVPVVVGGGSGRRSDDRGQLAGARGGPPRRGRLRRRGSPDRRVQIDPGDAVSFELVHREPGERPRSWFGEIGTSFESEPAVLVRAELDNAVARELVGRNIAHHVRTRRRPTAQATARSWTAQELQPVPDRRITATPSSSVPVRCRSDS